jgi:hypothetical protein
MMVKIQAFFGVSTEEELSEKIDERERYEVIRLWCRSKFVMREKLTIAYPAIIDTGAYVSLIPKEIWSKSEINILLKSHYVKGLIPKEECKMEVKVGGNHVAASVGLLRKAGFSDERIFGYYFCNLLAE